MLVCMFTCAFVFKHIFLFPVLHLIFLYTDSICICLYLCIHMLLCVYAFVPAFVCVCIFVCLLFFMFTFYTYVWLYLSLSGHT